MLHSKGSLTLLERYLLFIYEYRHEYFVFFQGNDSFPPLIGVVVVSERFLFVGKTKEFVCL